MVISPLSAHGPSSQDTENIKHGGVLGSQPLHFPPRLNVQLFRQPLSARTTLPLLTLLTVFELTPWFFKSHAGPTPLSSITP